MDNKLTFDDFPGNDVDLAQAIVRQMTGVDPVSLGVVRGCIIGPLLAGRRAFRVIADQADVLVKYVVVCDELTTSQSVLQFIRQARLQPGRTAVCLEQPERLHWLVARSIIDELERIDSSSLHLLVVTGAEGRQDLSFQRRSVFVLRLE